MTTVYLKTNEDGSQSFDTDKMALELLNEAHREWQNRHNKGSNINEEADEIKSWGADYYQRF